MIPYLNKQGKAKAKPYSLEERVSHFKPLKTVDVYEILENDLSRQKNGDLC